MWRVFLFRTMRATDTAASKTFAQRMRAELSLCAREVCVREGIDLHFTFALCNYAQDALVLYVGSGRALW